MEPLKYGSPEYVLAKERIEGRLKAAYAAISEAQSIADETGVGFSFSVAYGAGRGPRTAQSQYRCGRR